MTSLCLDDFKEIKKIESQILTAAGKSFTLFDKRLDSVLVDFVDTEEAYVRRVLGTENHKETVFRRFTGDIMTASRQTQYDGKWNISDRESAE